MCEPVTLIAAAGLAMQVSSAQQAASAQKSSLMYQSQVAENNAKTLEYQAQDAERRGQQDLIAARRQTDQVKGAQRAALAAKGLDLNEGTPLALQNQTDYFGEVDQTTVKNNTAKEAWRIRAGAANQKSDSLMLASKSNSTSPGMAGFSTLVSGAGGVADKWYKYGKTTPAPTSSIPEPDFSMGDW